MARTALLASPQTSDASAARWAKVIGDAAGPWTPGSRLVIGCVSGPSGWLRQRIRSRDGFQSLLVGTLTDGDDGTRLRGPTRLDRRTQALLTIWFGGVLLVGGFLRSARPPRGQSRRTLAGTADAGAGRRHGRTGPLAGPGRRTLPDRVPGGREQRAEGHYQITACTEDGMGGRQDLPGS